MWPRSRVTTNDAIQTVMRLSLGHIAAILYLVVAASGVRAQPANPPACDFVELQGDSLECRSNICKLQGKATLRCGPVRLHAEQVEIHLTADGSRRFQRAVATGNVTLIEANRVITCERVVLGPDRVHGKLVGATVRVKENPQTPSRPVPHGRTTSRFDGTIERTGRRTMVLTDATFTQCDCPGGTPSWQLSAARIDVTHGERATAWWPMFWINPFDLGLVPITPPLPPISVPLSEREPGFLAPNIQFLRTPYPTVDLPIFLPLGESWDLTLEPGVRTDWGEPDGALPARLGAPRFGGRLRYAPIQGTRGRLEAQWTWDHSRWAAKWRQIRARSDSGEQERTGPFDTEAADWPLQHRVSAFWSHRSDITPDLRLGVEAQWLSDDRILRDFGTRIASRTAVYMPSRAQLQWRRPGLHGTLAADYFLRLRNDPQALSNAGPEELRLPQRGPALGLRLLPTALAPGLHVDASGHFTRYGAYHPDAPPTLMSGGAQLGLRYAKQLGPVRLAARAGVDGMGAEAGDRSRAWSTAVHVDARASTTLARRFGQWLHTLEPTLRYQSIPWRARDLPGTALAPRNDRPVFHQVAGGISQGLWRVTPGGEVRELARLTLTQPLDATTGQLLESTINLEWTMNPFGQGHLRAGIAPTQTNFPVRALAAGWRWSSRWAGLNAFYTRWSPQAERFRRSLYAIAGPYPAQLRNDGWVHALRGGVSVRWPDVLKLRYSTALLLPTPSAPERLRVNEHAFDISYTSQCACWDIGVRVVVPTAAGQPVNIRLLNLNIGSYSLSNLGR